MQSLPSSMLAARITAPRCLQWVQTPLPRLEDLPGEPVLVHLHAGVLCASDFPRYLGGAFNVSFPRPLGDSLHECIGQVVASRSPLHSPGDMVLAVPPDQRGLSEYFVADGSMTVPIPTNFQPREQLILAQPLGTVIWGARKLPNLLGRDVAIIGQGPIGLLFTALVSNLGARRIIALDKLDYRLAAARQMRATHTVNVTQCDPRAAVKELTDGQGPEIVIEAVGHQPETLHLAVDLCQPAGTVLMFGVPDAEEYPLPVWNILRKNLRFVGSVHPEVQRDMRLAIDMITQGRINVAPLLTHAYPLEQIQDAFELAISRRENPIKVLIWTPHAGLPTPADKARG